MTDETEPGAAPPGADQDTASQDGSGAPRAVPRVRRAAARLRRGLGRARSASWLTAHWWTGVGGVVGVAGLVVGVLAWLAPAGGGEGEGGSGGGQGGSGADERWTATLHVSDAPVDADAMPPTTKTDRAASDFWVDTTEALETDAAVIWPGELSSVRKWQGPDEPSADSCRGEVRRPGDKETPVEYGHFFCLRTSEDRIAVVAVDSLVRDSSGAVAAELSLTVYAKRAL